MTRGRWLVATALAAAVLAAAAWVAVRWLPPRLAEWRLARWIDTPQGAPGAPPAVVTIDHGTSATEIARVIEAAGVASPARRLLVAAGRLGVDRALQPGIFRFARPLSPRAVLQILAGRDPSVTVVTIPEGLFIEETARVLADAGAGSEADLRRAFRDPTPLHALGLDPGAPDLEGYLLPGTYLVSRHVPATGIAALLVRAFKTRFAEPERGRIERSGRTLRQFVTLASLVEEETAVPEERGRVAGVFVERLARGMPLQCDPTVIAAARMAGRWTGNIRRSDLAFDHPYNTYVRGGLPPGPIVSPGIAALYAALEPVRDGSVYFVSDGNGAHVFSRTLPAHNRAVRRLLNRRPRRDASRCGGGSYPRAGVRCRPRAARRRGRPGCRAECRES